MGRRRINAFSVGSCFLDALIFGDMKISTQRKDLMSAWAVGKALPRNGISLSTREFTQERNLTDALIARNASVKEPLWLSMREPIWVGKNHINAQTVAKPTVTGDLLSSIGEFTLVRNLMSAQSVGKASNLVLNLESIKKPMGERSYISAHCVAKASMRNNPLLRTRGPIQERSLINAVSVGNASIREVT